MRHYPFDPVESKQARARLQQSGRGGVERERGRVGSELGRGRRVPGSYESWDGTGEESHTNPAQEQNTIPYGYC